MLIAQRAECKFIRNSTYFKFLMQELSLLGSAEQIDHCPVMAQCIDDHSVHSVFIIGQDPVIRVEWKMIDIVLADLSVTDPVYTALVHALSDLVVVGAKIHSVT